METKEITPKKYAKWWGCHKSYIQRLLQNEQFDKLPNVIRVKKLVVSQFEISMWEKKLENFKKQLLDSEISDLYRMLWSASKLPLRWKELLQASLLPESMSHIP